MIKFITDGITGYCNLCTLFGFHLELQHLSPLLHRRIIRNAFRRKLDSRSSTHWRGRNATLYANFPPRFCFFIITLTSWLRALYLCWKLYPTEYDFRLNGMSVFRSRAQPRIWSSILIGFFSLLVRTNVKITLVSTDSQTCGGFGLAQRGQDTILMNLHQYLFPYWPSESAGILKFLHNNSVARLILDWVARFCFWSPPSFGCGEPKNQTIVAKDSFVLERHV